MAQKQAVINIEKLYADGYAAFDRGDFARAVDLATTCWKAAAPNSYWFAGALGLRCWAAHFAGDIDTMEHDAHVLTCLDTGDDKPWFDGLALVNLGIMFLKLGNVDKAELLFSQASAMYAAARHDAGQAGDQALVKELFGAVTHWAATDDPAKIADLDERIGRVSHPDDETQKIQTAVRLYHRRAKGENVAAEAADAVRQGVNRTLLALLLL
jgi:hypothetical protein